MLDEFSTKWSKVYPRVISDWNNNIDTLLTFYKYPTSIRKCIYTTNWIERANKELKRRFKTKDSMPTINATEKILYMQVINYNEKWSQRKMSCFSTAYDDLMDMFKERYDL
ncbi:MAG: putative transposase [Candidatus Petromonas sp.]|jgi:transposase-like protein|nr:putative transposase [Candidatus Petromonas sp.]